MSGRSRGLQLEIVASLTVVMLAGILIVAVVLGSLALQTVQGAAIDQLELGATHLRQTLLLRPFGLGDLSAWLRAQGGPGAGSWRVLGARGDPLGPGRDPVSEPVRGLVEGARRQGRAWSGAGLPLRDVVLVERIVSGRGEVGYLVGTIGRDRLSARLLPLLGAGSWVLGIAAAVFVLFGSYLLRERIVAPVQRLADVTHRVAAGELEARTVVAGSDELSDLGERFNYMASALQQQRDTVVQAFESLARSQRLATVGQLAAGVAHEVGNPVAAILGYAEVASRDPALSPRGRESVEHIRREALRIRGLVRQLLDLARPDALALAPHGAAEVLERVATLLRPQKLLDGIELVVDAAPDLPAVVTDGRRVEQILINLVENAAHAVRGADLPRVTLGARVSRVPFSRGRRHSDLDVERASALVLEVGDNGSGIPDALADRIFDPFFTTKDPGEGTGLGLWNAHRLAEALDGRLEVQSGPGETRFSLILPLADNTEA